MGESEYIAQHGVAPRANLAQVADHIDHVRKIAGADHIGIAGDFWGAGDEVVAHRLQQDRPPSTATIEQLDGPTPQAAPASGG